MITTLFQLFSLYGCSSDPFHSMDILSEDTPYLSISSLATALVHFSDNFILSPPCTRILISITYNLDSRVIVFHELGDVINVNLLIFCQPWNC